jgi:hypothetical protein
MPVCLSGTLTTGKTGVAVHIFFAVRRRTVKPSLPCDRRKTHGNAQAYGKELTKRTAKTCNTANDRKTHGKE